jgi:hypothetical protein
VKSRFDKMRGGMFYPIAVRHNKPGSPSSITAW